jgi:hypothetical protein
MKQQDKLLCETCKKRLHRAKKKEKKQNALYTANPPQDAISAFITNFTERIQKTNEYLETNTPKWEANPNMFWEYPEPPSFLKISTAICFDTKRIQDHEDSNLIAMRRRILLTVIYEFREKIMERIKWLADAGTFFISSRTHKALATMVIILIASSNNNSKVWNSRVRAGERYIQVKGSMLLRLGDSKGNAMCVNLFGN